MDSHILKQLQRIEEKLDLLLQDEENIFDNKTNEDDRQEYFPWYKDVESPQCFR